MLKNKEGWPFIWKCHGQSVFSVAPRTKPMNSPQLLQARKELLRVGGGSVLLAREVGYSYQTWEVASELFCLLCTAIVFLIALQCILAKPQSWKKMQFCVISSKTWSMAAQRCAPATFLTLQEIQNWSQKWLHFSSPQSPNLFLENPITSLGRFPGRQ